MEKEALLKYAVNFVFLSKNLLPSTSNTKMEIMLFLPIWLLYYLGNFGGFSLGKSLTLFLAGYYVLSNDAVMKSWTLFFYLKISCPAQAIPKWKASQWNWPTNPHSRQSYKLFFHAYYRLKRLRRSLYSGAALVYLVFISCFHVFFDIISFSSI